LSEFLLDIFRFFLDFERKMAARFDGKVTESVAEAFLPYPPLHSLDVLNTNC
jgi:hypothetical protein